SIMTTNIIIPPTAKNGISSSIFHSPYFSYVILVIVSRCACHPAAPRHLAIRGLRRNRARARARNRSLLNLLPLYLPRHAAAIILDFINQSNEEKPQIAQIVADFLREQSRPKTKRKKISMETARTETRTIPIPNPIAIPIERKER